MATFTYNRGFYRWVLEATTAGVSTHWPDRETSLGTTHSDWVSYYMPWYPNAAIPYPLIPYDQWGSTGGGNTTMGPMIVGGKMYTILNWQGNFNEWFIWNLNDNVCIPLLTIQKTREGTADNFWPPEYRETGIINPQDEFIDFIADSGVPETRTSGQMLYPWYQFAPIPNTNSFYVLCQLTQDTTYRCWRFFWIRYEITSDLVVTAVERGYEWGKGSDNIPTSYATDPYTFRYGLKGGTIDTFHDGTKSHIAIREDTALIGNYAPTDVGWVGQPMIWEMPHSTGDTDNRVHRAIEGRITTSGFGSNTWQTYRSKFGHEKYTKRAQFVETNGVLEMLQWSPTSEPYINRTAREVPCPIEDGAVGPRLYKSTPSTIVNDHVPSVNYTDVSSLFGIPWSDSDPLWQRHDGSIETNTGLRAMNYYHMSTFKYGTDWFVGFVRLYSDNPNVCRIRIYLWNDGNPQPFLDISNFDMWADAAGNGTIFDRVNEARVNIYGLAARHENYRAGYENGSNVHLAQPYLWIDYSTGDLYVYGNWGQNETLSPPNGFWFTQVGEITAGSPPATADIYFSDFVEKDDFQDWIIGLNAGAEFTAYLETSYHMMDDSMMWMQSPYLYTHLNNRSNCQIEDSSGNKIITKTGNQVASGTDVGLFVNGKWDFVS